MTATTIPAPAAPVLAPEPTLDRPEPRAGLGKWWRDTLVFATRQVQHIRQIPEKLLDVTLQPLMFVLLFAYVFGGAIAVNGGNYREFLIAGILVQTVAFGLAGPATAIATDLTEGVVDRFRSLPTSRSAFLSGHVLAEFGGMVLAIAILCVTGLIVGWRVHEPFIPVLGAFVLLLLFAAAMIWVGTWVGLMVRSPDAVMGIAFTVVFPLTFLSSAFVPIDTLPTVLQYVAQWNPITVIVTAVRDMFGNSGAPLADPSWAVQHAVPVAFGMCFAILAVAIPASLHRFKARTSD
jgi:ABC-2 type transport system permease protein